MNTTNHDVVARLVDALADADSSARLRAALSAGTLGDPRLVETLVARCAVEPDFFVRDMLTWALCRLPAEITVPRLLAELVSDRAQARSQALHTLSKIGDRGAWPAVSALLHDEHDEVALSAWRAATVLVPPGEERELAGNLAIALGRGDHQVQRSLSRALAALDEAAAPVLDAAMAHPDPRVRAHAEATERLRLDPDSGFTLSLEMAKRIAVTGTDT
ncbi:HEAT repeat domain-containing protein [Nocardia cyriacigeorgica]|uniref:HEAT repeat domain-containing protein n=1 Tax=Nocardia cyriacigeorgica TaxID=135487 RepID=A0A6P1DC83_9NOCA|nr:HEAT repeat domain-containing protein [Nocardia cyriacigeorgica]NEW39856.1 HEAT repeat domain-containing protein [Nocardia cyriacigeorgica]NEW47179.1 HEAT repeat domain-containing protein [Nocardia cyriacigeorgica]NEW51341.1 HEAT repeat domain-containing protein [Nocardia cyriacigeorgica]NEW55440.1 HEAT repeat domain-containing protein [Nocardia cyriacigeorgica]